MSKVTYSGDPVIRWSLSQECFIVEKPYTCTWNRPGKELWKMTVPAGFDTDLASIPRIVPISRVDAHIPAAVVHDRCYTMGGECGLTRVEADRLMLCGMKCLGVYWLRRWVIYAAIRTFGQGKW